MDIPKTALKWRMQTWFVLIAGLTAILIALIASFAFATFKPTTEVRVGQSGIYHLWLAKTDTELYRGLSGVEQLPRNGGLLMDFTVDGLHGIVMRDMNIPLDILWLDKNREIIGIKQNVAPELGESKVFTPAKPARYVLELPAGSVKNSAIKMGDIAEFTLEGTGI